MSEDPVKAGDEICPKTSDMFVVYYHHLSTEALTWKKVVF